MSSYLPPLNISEIFNVDDYIYQDGFIVYKDADHRYLRPIQNLQQKTTGITYSNTTTNITANVNVAGLMNGVNGAVRNDVAIGESLSVGSNIVCGKNFINSGNIYTNNIYAKSIVITDAVLTNVNIDGIQVRNIGFINTLSSDVQIQINTNYNQLNTRITDTNIAQKTYIDASYATLNTRITNTDSARKTYIDKQILSLGGYFINQGIGSFPIYGSISNFADLGMDLYIKSQVDSFCILPGYAIFVFSDINEKGSYLSMGNTSTNIEYYNLDGINGLIRVKSCVLYKLDDNQRFNRVATINHKNPDKAWSLQTV